MRTCLQTKGNKDTRLLEADYHTHPAWTKNSKNTALTGNIIGLAKKHKGFEDL